MGIYRGAHTATALRAGCRYADLGITGGILLGSLVAIAVQASYTAAEVTAWAWRIPFILGGVFGLISVYLRRFLQETPIFKEMAAKRTLSEEMPVKTVLKNHKMACFVTAGLTGRYPPLSW